MLIGVYFIQNLIQNLDQVMSGVVWLFQNSSGFDPAGDFRRLAAVRPDHGIKPGAHWDHPAVGGHAADGSDAEASLHFFCVYLVFYGVLLFSAASVPAFDHQVYGMRHMARLQGASENYPLVVCFLLSAVLSVPVDSSLKIYPAGLKIQKSAGFLGSLKKPRLKPGLF